MGLLRSYLLRDSYTSAILLVSCAWVFLWMLIDYDRHFGRGIISELLGTESYSEPVIEELWLKLYKASYTVMQRDNANTEETGVC